jgi:hypothetical protein
MVSSTPTCDPIQSLTWSRPDVVATHAPRLVRLAERQAPRNHHRRTRRLLAYVLLEDPPGLSPTTVARFATVEAAQVATDEVWASR